MSALNSGPQGADAGTGGVLATPNFGDPVGATLRILSANMWSGNADPDGFAALVQELGADVVACQELTQPQADALREVLPYGELSPADSHMGMGLALARPAEVRRIPLRYRDAFAVQLDPESWPGLEAPLEILNVHIAAPHASSLPGLAFWHRAGQVRGLEEYLAADASGPGEQISARVLVGDLNATPVWPVYQRLTSHLRDAAVIDAQRNGRSVEPTWGPWHGAPRMLRIDHGLVSGVRVEAFRVVTIAGSDHSGVVLDVGPEL